MTFCFLWLAAQLYATMVGVDCTAPVPGTVVELQMPRGSQPGGSRYSVEVQGDQENEKFSIL